MGKDLLVYFKSFENFMLWTHQGVREENKRYIATRMFTAIVFITEESRPMLNNQERNELISYVEPLIRQMLYSERDNAS